MTDQAIKMAANAAWNSDDLLTDIGWFPNEQIVRFVAKYLRKRAGLDRWEYRRSCEDVLDLGCGTGRHVKYMVEQGFTVSGIDISAPSVSFAKEWMESEGHAADLRIGSATELPFASEAFDALISHGVLDHMSFEDAKTTASEARRVIKSDGLFYLDLISTTDSGFGKGTQIDSHTFVVPDGIETNAIQCFFDPGRIDLLLAGLFRVRDIVYQEWSPIRGEGFSLLDKDPGGSWKLARYHIVSEPV